MWGGLKCDGPKGITFIEGTVVKSRRTGKPAAGPSASSVGDRIFSVSPPLKVNQLELYICCGQKHLRRGAAIDLVLQKTHLSEIAAAASAATSGQIFHQAILSFGAILFGSKHGQAAITNRGYVLHGAALKGLNLALSQPDCYMRDDVILSVSTLAILECLTPTGPRNYLKHMVGLERLLELRGPVSCSAISFEVYKSVRHMILFASLRTGNPSILAREEWKTALRAHCSDDDLPEQNLFNILADCTVLSVRRNRILASWQLNPQDSWTQERESIEERALILLAQLQDWRKTWKSDARNLASVDSDHSLNTSLPVDSHSGYSGHQNTRAPAITLLCFYNASAAVMWMFYNTTLIYVFRILASLPFENSDSPKQNIGPTQTTPSSLDPSRRPPGGYAAAERSAALDICRCIPYYSTQISTADPDMSPIPHWAIMTAWATLCLEESIEGKWITDLLETNYPDIVAKGVWTDRDR
ncbi:hypothetical protein TWF696_002723 [Orbilia brochopaga]|uniref:Uncharacterized protein n=1 Tax=Orbilia brochopaga TaxID=3140254 RepID=A0AAV9U2J3_9PEZI